MDGNINIIPQPAISEDAKAPDSQREIRAALFDLVPAQVIKAPVVFTTREWLALMGSLGLAALYMHIFGLENLWNRGIPGLGITVFVFALFGFSLTYLGKRAKYTAANIFLLTATGLLALSCTIFGSIPLRIINCFVILSVGALTMFQLSGQAENAWSRAAVVWETIALTFSSLFCNIDKPFRAVTSVDKKRRYAGPLALGIVIAMPVLMLVLSLLISADAIFAQIFTDIGRWMNEWNAGKTVWNATRAIIYTIFVFSGIYSLRHHREKGELTNSELSEEIKTEGRVVFGTLLVILNIAYAVFVAIQIAFLFGGAETAVLQGGYAEYARSGFFQLVAVTGINLFVVLITTTVCFKSMETKHPVLQGLCLLLIGMTCVILASALWRMSLYISVFGLTLLRALTLWGMLVIAVSLIVATVKTIRPVTKFFPVFFAFALSTWIVFNYININARIADYNVGAYLSGKVEQIDVFYLDMPDAILAINRLEEATGEDYGMIKWVAPSPYWTQWNYSDVRYLDN